MKEVAPSRWKLTMDNYVDLAEACHRMVPLVTLEDHRAWDLPFLVEVHRASYRHVHASLVDHPSCVPFQDLHVLRDHCNC